MAKFFVRRTNLDGHVGLGAALKSGGYRHDRISSVIGCDLSTADARVLAAALVAEADRVDAAVAKKKASEERRKKWRDREVAAGRMKIFTASEFFGR